MLKTTPPTRIIISGLIIDLIEGREQWLMYMALLLIEIFVINNLVLASQDDLVDTLEFAKEQHGQLVNVL